MKILILKPSSLGDVVQALPVLRLLKLAQPRSEIWWWIDESLAPLLRGDPDLTGIHPFPRRRWGSPRHWPEAIAFVHSLRAERYDWVIDLQSLARSGFLAWFAGGRLTVGLDDAREGARGFYDVSVRRPSRLTHAVDWYLETLRWLGVPVHFQFEWLPRQAEVATTVAARWNPRASRWIALQPGARWENKRWPLAHFRELVALLARSDGRHRFVVLGGSADRALAAPIVEAAPDRCFDLTGQTSLPEMVEWLRHCDLLVTNDTGPMHVAAALGKPVVALFGPTEPRRTGPYGQVDHVLRNRELACAPCMRSTCSHTARLECLRSLAPARVAEVVRQHLRE